MNTESKIMGWIKRNKKKLFIAGGLTLAVIATAVGVTLVTKKNDEVLEIGTNDNGSLVIEETSTEVVE